MSEGEGDSQRERLLERLRRDCGKQILEALQDPSVNEVMLNPDGNVWLDVVAQGMVNLGPILPATRAESILATSATLLHTTITRDNPVVEGEFPLDGSRLEGLLPPVVAKPTFAIRKRAQSVFALDDYVARSIVSSAQAAALRESIRSKHNILIVGGTGSGKTTLSNAILAEIATLCPVDRVVAIEDTYELRVEQQNHVLMRSSELTPMPRLLRATMRLRPDRIVIGEVRGGEAYTLLKAWNSGHPGGLTTIHADSAAEGLGKLGDYIHEAEEARNFTSEHVARMIANAVDVVVFISKINEAPWRRVSEICRVSGAIGSSYELLSL